jgi:hypothetical protein
MTMQRNPVIIVATLVGMLFVWTNCSDDTQTPAKEAGLMDAGVKEASMKEAGSMDAGVKEASVKEAGLMDAGVKEAGAKEAGLVDSAEKLTPCGTNLSCKGNSEICVASFGGIGANYHCELIPKGCENDRTCQCVSKTLCLGIFDACVDPSSQENTVFCECATCA